LYAKLPTHSSDIKTNNCSDGNEQTSELKCHKKVPKVLVVETIESMQVIGAKCMGTNVTMRSGKNKFYTV